MTFFGDEHHAFRAKVREFVDTELAPHADEWEARCEFPRSVFRRCGELGILGAPYPKAVGGAGGDWWHLVVWNEEIPRANCSAIAGAMLVQGAIATPIIAQVGTREQQSEFLTPALRGERIGAIGMTEPHCGSDVAAIRTTARRVGDEFVIDGAKSLISNGARADFITLVARTGGEGLNGLSIILFPTDTKGFKVVKKVDKIGTRAIDTANLSFEGCRVPARLLLGVENRGFGYLMAHLPGERIMGAAKSVATAAWVIDECVRYARERKLFGKSLLDFQVWQHAFADLRARIEAARWLTYRAVDLYNQGKNAVLESSMAKLVACELLTETVDRCLQAYGGYGYTEDLPIARAFRDARVMPITGGSSEVMRDIIARLSGWTAA